MTGQSRASGDDMASAMARATLAAVASGTREGAFGSVGAGAAYVPDIKDLLPDDEVVDEAEDEAADGEVGAGENGPQGPKGKNKDELPWFNRDDRVGQELRAHESCVRSSQKELKDCVNVLEAELARVTSDMADNVRNEVKSAKNRAHPDRWN